MVDELLGRLERVRKVGRGWQARCPSHEDRNPSLSIDEGNEGIVLYCHAGCSTEEIVEQLGLRMSDLFTSNGRAPRGDEPEAVYRYEDEKGRLLFEVVRKPGKDFRQRQPDGVGGYVWNLDGVERVLYRLPRILDAVRTGETVRIVEGERDVHAVEPAGGIATCNPMGAGKWRPEYAETLRGANVVVVADRDAEGRRHAAEVVASLGGVAASLRVVEAATGKDAHDHLAAGRTLDEFVELELEAGPPHSWTPINLRKLEGREQAEPTIGGIVYPGKRHALSGEPESLKSWAALVLCALELKAGANVLYLNLETDAHEIRERLRDLGVPDEHLEPNRLVYLQPSEPMTQPDVLADVQLLVAERRPTLVVVDATDGALELHGCDPNSSRDVERFYRTVVAPLRGRGAASIAIDHLTRDPEKRGMYAIGSQRKIGAVDVHLRLECVQPFARGRTGRATITVKKDRPGWLPRPQAGELVLRSDPSTFAITYALEVATRDAGSSESEQSFRPTVLMERVSRYLEVQAELASRNAVETTVSGKAKFVRQAIDCLVAEGYAREETGSNRARLLGSIKPFDTTSSSPVRPERSATSSSPVRPSLTLLTMRILAVRPGSSPVRPLVRPVSSSPIPCALQGRRDGAGRTGSGTKSRRLSVSQHSRRTSRRGGNSEGPAAYNRRAGRACRRDRATRGRPCPRRAR